MGVLGRGGLVGFRVWVLLGLLERFGFFFLFFQLGFGGFFGGGVLGLGLGFLVGFSGVFGGFRVYWWVLG